MRWASRALKSVPGSGGPVAGNENLEQTIVNNLYLEEKNLARLLPKVIL